jgi:hypothetical protein
VGIGLLTLLAAAAAEPRSPGREPCGEDRDPQELLDELEAAALEGRVDEAETLKQHTLRELTCGGLVEREWLARWWLAEAALAAVHGDDQSAEDALAAAARLAPEVWVEGYGPAFRSRHAALAQDRAALPQGRLVLSVRVEGLTPPGGQILAAVDGEPVRGFGVGLSAGLSAGYHLLQLGFSPTDIRYASAIYVVPGQDLVVHALLPGDVPLPAPVEPVPVGPVRRRVPLFLAAGGVLGLGAATTSVLAVSQNGAMRRAQSVDRLDSAYQSQQVLGATSYVLMGATAVCLGLEIAL